MAITGHAAQATKNLDSAIDKAVSWDDYKSR